MLNIYTLDDIKHIYLHDNRNLITVAKKNYHISNHSAHTSLRKYVYGNVTTTQWV